MTGKKLLEIYFCTFSQKELENIFDFLTHVFQNVCEKYSIFSNFIESKKCRETILDFFLPVTYVLW